MSLSNTWIASHQVSHKEQEKCCHYFLCLSCYAGTWRPGKNIMNEPRLTISNPLKAKEAGITVLNEIGLDPYVSEGLSH